MLLEMLETNWPVALVCVLMVVGAVIDAWKLKVPNWLTFAMILSGWLYWATQGWALLGTSLAGTVAAGALLILPYAIGGMGAGDVKLYAGFGGWMVPIEWFGFEQLFWAFAVSVLVGAGLAIFLILWKGTALVNLENAKDIVGDWKTSKSIGEVADKAKQRKPSLMLLPYGVPLTIGSLAYLAYIFPYPSHAAASSMALLSLVAGLG